MDDASPTFDEQKQLLKRQLVLQEEKIIQEADVVKKKVLRIAVIAAASGLTALVLATLLRGNGNNQEVQAAEEPQEPEAEAPIQNRLLKNPIVQQVKKETTLVIAELVKEVVKKLLDRANHEQ